MFRLFSISLFTIHHLRLRCKIMLLMFFLSDVKGKISFNSLNSTFFIFRQIELKVFVEEFVLHNNDNIEVFIYYQSIVCTFEDVNIILPAFNSLDL